jgi:hypothetical protein
VDTFAHQDKFSLSFKNFKIIEIKLLREHEGVDAKHLNKLKERIKSDKVLKKPIIVDKNTNVVLDGHHRLIALKELGCKKIPVIFLNYRSPKIKVFSWRKGEKVTKGIVLKAAFSGKKLPPKTSKHMIKIGKKLTHISIIEKNVNLPLRKLK